MLQAIPQPLVQAPTFSLQLVTRAPNALANFLAVILDSEIHDGSILTIGTTRFIFREGHESNSTLSFTFNGFQISEINNFHQRANFYHFRESKNLSEELIFHLPRLEMTENVLSLSWRDWDGRSWSFSTRDDRSFSL